MANKKYVSLSKLSTFLDNLKNTFSIIGHKHNIEDVNLTVDSELSSTSLNPVQNKVIDAEFEAMSTAMMVLEAAMDDKADVSHNHSDVYYTKTELDEHLSNAVEESLAQAKNSGEFDGKDGDTPIRGTDYWTDADKAEIKAYVDDAILNGAW